MLRAAEAMQLGLADAAFEPADFLERSLEWAGKVLAGEIRVERPDHAGDEGTWDAAVAAGRQWLDERLHGAAPAPYEALELVAAARTRTRDEGFAAEDEVLGRLLVSNEFRAGLYSFDLTQKRAKRPAGAPSADLAKPVTKVGVVGAGLMASQLALLFARNLQVPVVMSDLDQQRVDRGLGYVHGEVDKLLGKGRITPDAANRLKALVTGTTDTGDFADASLVIEAVFEEMSVKKQVFAQLEQVVSPECILATNTSSLSVTEMSADLAHPERVIGLHFFNPVAVMPLLEVVRTEHTDDATAATGFAVGKQLKKSCVGTADAAGFVVNRILMRFIGDVTASLDNGTPPQVADASLDPLGLPMRPFVLTQLVGPAVALHVVETLHAAFPDRFPVSTTLRKLVDSGAPGLWSWDAQGKPYLSDETKALLPEGEGETGEAIRTRALEALAKEIRLMLDEGIVAEPQDIDLCMIMGAGWPFHLGGITPYLDREGVSERVTGRRFLPTGVAEPALTA
jgi:3-hydroxyacyl-CoA dehydrogenase